MQKIWFLYVYTQSSHAVCAACIAVVCMRHLLGLMKGTLSVCSMSRPSLYHMLHANAHSRALLHIDMQTCRIRVSLLASKGAAPSKLCTCNGHVCSRMRWLCGAGDAQAIGVAEQGHEGHASGQL